jgi:protein-S-isoprenylcysteine O-methyltransferase Ste14
VDEPRDAANVRIFPPAVPLLAILAGVFLERAWPIDPGVSLPGAARYWIGGAIALGGFGALGVYAVVLFRRSGQHPNPRKPTPSIVERGPYRFTRNPMYLSFLLLCIGCAVMLMNVWILLLTPVVAGVLQHFVIRHEEAYLEHKFGEGYLAYKRRVRRWL